MRCIDLRTLFRISISILVSLVLVVWLAGPPSSGRAQGISYLYDAAGRLIAVVVPGTGTAVYAYDAVGNLLSITRYASTAVLIVDFSPGPGSRRHHGHHLGRGIQCYAEPEHGAFQRNAGHREYGDRDAAHRHRPH